jgi:hypothetical protein
MGILRVAGVVVAMSVLLTACGESDDESKPTDPGSSQVSTPSSPSDPTSPTDGPTDPTTSPSGTPGTGDIAEQARADLADRLGVPASDITVVSSKPVTWSDASLGCPKPGMFYAQVLTDGTQTILEYDGKQYSYHSGGQRPEPFLCKHPKK